MPIPGLNHPALILQLASQVLDGHKRDLIFMHFSPCSHGMGFQPPKNESMKCLESTTHPSPQHPSLLFQAMPLPSHMLKDRSLSVAIFGCSDHSSLHCKNIIQKEPGSTPGRHCMWKIRHSQLIPLAQQPCLNHTPRLGEPGEDGGLFKAQG